MAQQAAEQSGTGVGNGEVENSETTLTVIIAFFANLLIAVAKTLVAVVSGSASMLAESAHSWADTGNQILLLVADRRSKRPPDAQHPFGYGREAYVWSMFAAMGLFTAGAVVSIWNGVSKLFESGEEASYFWAYVVLGLAFVFEGISFTQAYRQTRKEAQSLDRDVLEHALRTSDPTLRAVFAEDSAALIGLVVAGLGVLLHQLTGEAVYDAVGSILVGLLLGVVAVVLMNQNRRFLTGQETDGRIREAVLDRLKEMPEVDRVTYLRLEYVGPRQMLLVAGLDLAGEESETQVARRLRRLEELLEADPNITEAVLTLSVPEDASL
jgi:cation diffusion facilitator family transporter